jgi:PKD repeat protein
VKAQNTCFQKVYSLGDTNVFFNDAKVLPDSTFLVSGSVGRGIQRFYPVFSEINKQGNLFSIDKFIDTTFLHKTGYSYTNLDTNIYGKYILHYSTVHKNLNPLWFHSRLSWNKNQSFGTRNFLDTLSNAFNSYLDGARLIINNDDSSYFTISNFSYLSDMDTSSSLPDSYGIVLIKFSQMTDSIVWLKKISLAPSSGVSLGQHNLLKKNDGNLLLIAQQSYNNSSFFSQNCLVKFYTINASTGAIMSTKQLHDTPWNEPSFGATFINNEKDLLISYTESDTLYTDTGIPQPYYGVRPTVARLDSNFNVVWKDTLRTYFSSTLNCGECIEKFVVNDEDSSFVAAYSYSTVINPDPANFLFQNPLRITKRSQNDGSVFWNRDYVYYPVDYYNDPLYQISDAEKTLDGGYIFVGSVENSDSLQANAPGQLGYILKTNCLGFLDDPQAGFSATTTTDSLAVNFQNTSLMGGSFEWSFGDGTEISTGENADSVSHTYLDSGTYQVQLIAYGCNGANDTLTQTVVVSKSAPVEVANPNITNYMAVGPNPVKSGESIAVYVGNLPSTSAVLAFYDYQGKLVLERAIPQENSTYIIVLPFSAGVYQAVLKDGKELLEVEKILIY